MAERTTCKVVSLVHHRIVAGRAPDDLCPFAPNTIQRFRRPRTFRRALLLSMGLISLVAFAAWACIALGVPPFPALFIKG